VQMTNVAYEQSEPDTYRPDLLPDNKRPETPDNRQASYTYTPLQMSRTCRPALTYTRPTSNTFTQGYK